MKRVAFLLIALFFIGCSTGIVAPLCDYCQSGGGCADYSPDAYPCESCKGYHFSCGNESPLKRYDPTGKAAILTVCPKHKQ